MLEYYGIQDVASTFVRLRGRLLWRLRPLSSFFDLISTGFCWFWGWFFCCWAFGVLVVFFFLMEAYGIDSLLFLQHPCSSLTLLLLLQLQWQKGFAQGAADINHQCKTEREKYSKCVFQGRQLCSLFYIQV